MPLKENTDNPIKFLEILFEKLVKILENLMTAKKETRIACETS